MTGQANFLQSLGWAVLNSLWQLALLWIIYQVLTAVFKSARPAAKSILASSLLIAGFGWFLFTFFFAFNNSADAPLTAGLINETVAPGTETWLQKALPAASTLYLFLLIIPVLRFIKNFRYVQVIRRYGLSKPAPEWRIFVNSIATRMGIRKPVHIWISEWVSSPVTIGFLKPIILVPMAAINHLGTEQMEAVLLHELSHIRRYDYLLNLVLNFIRTILYFNPFVKAFVSIVEKEREKSCDEMVLQFQYDSHQYASALLTLEKASREHQLLVVGAAGHNDLLHRIERILGVPRKQTVSLRRLSHALAALVCIITLNALMVFGKPLTAKMTAQYGVGMTSSLLRDNSGFASTQEREIPISNNLPVAAASYLPPKDRSAGASFAFSRINPQMIPASVETEIVPDIKLEKFEEAQVKEAIEASKKVIENQQWKSVEKALADVFNEDEKESLKTALKNEMEKKVDWNNWENKLRMAYDKVDWDKVNYQLHDAINRIQTDSLVKVYTDAIVNLNNAQKELTSLSLKGYPDSDISLKTLAEKQRSLQRAVTNLKATRTKKIVHL
jgi:bla regulator protein blaR1